MYKPLDVKKIRWFTISTQCIFRVSQEGAETINEQKENNDQDKVTTPNTAFFKHEVLLLVRLSNRVRDRIILLYKS